MPHRSGHQMGTWRVDLLRAATIVAGSGIGLPPEIPNSCRNRTARTFAQLPVALKVSFSRNSQPPYRDSSSFASKLIWQSWHDCIRIFDRISWHSYIDTGATSRRSYCRIVIRENLGPTPVFDNPGISGKWSRRAADLTQPLCVVRHKSAAGEVNASTPFSSSELVQWSPKFLTD